MVAPAHPDPRHLRAARHHHVVGRVADHDRLGRAEAGLRHGLFQHRRMRLRGRVVGGLDRAEPAVPAVGGDEVVDPAARLAGGDAEAHAGHRVQAREEVGGPRKQRLAQGRLGPQPPERRLVVGGERRHRPVRPDQRREGLRQRESDHRERPLAARCRQAHGREGGALRRHDEMLAVDEGPVDVEDDEGHALGPSAAAGRPARPLRGGCGRDSRAGSAHSPGGTGSGSGAVGRP